MDLSTEYLSNTHLACYDLRQIWRIYYGRIYETATDIFVIYWTNKSNFVISLTNKSNFAISLTNKSNFVISLTNNCNFVISLTIKSNFAISSGIMTQQLKLLFFLNRNSESFKPDNNYNIFQFIIYQTFFLIVLFLPAVSKKYVLKE